MISPSQIWKVYKTSFLMDIKNLSLCVNVSCFVSFVLSVNLCAICNFYGNLISICCLFNRNTFSNSGSIFKYFFMNVYCTWVTRCDFCAIKIPFVPFTLALVFRYTKCCSAPRMTAKVNMT